MFWQVTQQLLEGFESTLKLFCITLVAALPLGLIISFGSMSKFRPLKWLCKTPVSYTHLDVYKRQFLS